MFDSTQSIDISDANGSFKTINLDGSPARNSFGMNFDIKQMKSSIAKLDVQQMKKSIAKLATGDQETDGSTKSFIKAVHANMTKKFKKCCLVKHWSLWNCCSCICNWFTCFLPRNVEYGSVPMSINTRRTSNFLHKS